MPLKKPKDILNISKEYSEVVMANTYTQLFVHIIFSTKGREKALSKHFREELFKYIS